MAEAKKRKSGRRGSWKKEMTNKELYVKAFVDAFEVEESVLPGMEYTGIPAWDSVGHMNLVAMLEDAFDIMMDTDDIIDFNSFEKGMELLKDHYNVEF